MELNIRCPRKTDRAGLKQIKKLVAKVEKSRREIVVVMGVGRIF
jgi:hypothetical protein